MAEKQDELLLAACDRIRELAYPAYAKSSEMRYLAVNAAYARLFDMEPEDMVGTWSEAREGCDQGRGEHERRCLIFGTVEKVSYSCPADKAGFVITMERQRLSDDIVMLVGTFTPADDVQTEGMSPASAGRDEALHQSEEQLKQRLEEVALYRALLDELPVASFMRDDRQRLLFANRAYLQLTGQNVEDLLGRTPLETEREHGPVFHRWNQHVLDTGELAESEIEYRRPDGVVVPTISRLHRVTTIDAHRYLIGSVTDTTALKKREEDLQQLLVRAETADRAKSDFLANMSHEIRTPMNGVLGMAELLAKTGLDTRQKTFVDIIAKSANALLTIINDILDFSRIDAGQVVLRNAPFNPAEAIEDVATLLSARAAEKDIELIIRGTADMPATVVGDAGRFRQIVTNLVGNAVKFTDHGHVLIDMSAKPADSATATVLTIRVQDTGAGIPTDKIPFVFEKFSQVDSSSTRRHEGTGLGLAITEGLVHLFGGTLEVESEMGTGSAFTVNLPVTVVPAVSQTHPVPANLRGARVLVVDEHPLSRRSMCDLLAQWAFDVAGVASGEEASAMLAAAKEAGLAVDVVIFDYQPGRPGGASAADTIRRYSEFDPVATVVLTPMNLSPEDPVFSSPRVQAHLMKPVRAGLLRETLCEILRSARGNRSLGAASGRVLPLKPDASAGQTTPELEAGSGAVDILVAEDNEVNQILFTQLLQATGLNFRIVANGREAVAAYRDRRPGMILMDLSMPVMDGHQATRAIREIEQEADCRVPIVAVTAHVLDGGREECFAAGMDDYLAKPISIEKLEEKIHRWLGPAGIASAKAATIS
ncbi:MAG: response regulator [Shinella sp.]|nr:response regulator [Shinella sp.]